MGESRRFDASALDRIRCFFEVDLFLAWPLNHLLGYHQPSFGLFRGIIDSSTVCRRDVRTRVLQAYTHFTFTPQSVAWFIWATRASMATVPFADRLQQSSWVASGAVGLRPTPRPMTQPSPNPLFCVYTYLFVQYLTGLPER